LRVLAFIFGVILLMPGACSIVFIGLSVGDSSLGPLPLLWLVCFGISFGGFLLIRYAFQAKASPQNSKKEDPTSPEQS
jgi:hypothetical protein